MRLSLFISSFLLLFISLPAAGVTYMSAEKPVEEVKKALQDDALWSKQLENLKQIKDDLFESHYGFSSEVAVACIRNIHAGKASSIKSSIYEIKKEHH